MCGSSPRGSGGGGNGDSDGPMVMQMAEVALMPTVLRALAVFIVVSAKVCPDAFQL